MKTELTQTEKNDTTPPPGPFFLIKGDINSLVPPPSDGLGCLPDHYQDPEQQAGEHHGDPGSNSAESSPPESSQSDKIYGFSRSLTMGTGNNGGIRFTPNEAVVLRHLAYKIRRSKNPRDGRTWFYISAADLARKFPWIAAKTMSAILKRLAANGVVIRSSYNRRPGDRTMWYSMDEGWLDRAEQDLIYFRDSDAERFGFCEAVLLHNLTYWLGNGKQKTTDVAERRHAMRPTELSRHIPFSIATIKRALGRLENEGAIMGYPNNEKRCRDYALAGRFLDRISLKLEVTTPGGPDAIQVPKDQESPATPTPTQASALAPEERVRALTEGNITHFAGFPENKIQAFVALCGKDAGHIIFELTDEHIANFLQRLSTDELLTAVEELCKPYNIDDVRLRYVHEILVRALSAKELYSLTHWCIARVVGQLEMVVYDRSDRWRRANRKAQYEKRVTRLGGLQIPGEATVDAAPAEKARILRNGIQARNRIGRLDENTILVTAYLVASRKSITLAEEFFGRNPAWAPSDVLKVLDECVQREAEPEDDGFDRLWHARRGRNLGFLIRHLENIVQELGLSASFPAIVFEESPTLENQERNPQQGEHYASAGAADPT
jgi:hypothetical protein